MRKLVQTDETRYQRWTCSECNWRFVPEKAVEGKTMAEMIEGYNRERDKAFGAHECRYYPKKRVE